MTDSSDYYRQLFAPLEATIGKIDPNTRFAVIGFDMGGPLSLCTIGADNHSQFVTYVSCELAVRDQQRPSSIGRYELLCSSDSEQWARSILSAIGRASAQMEFGPGHTIDLGPLVQPSDSLQGVLFETEIATQIHGRPVGILRVIGITRNEMEHKRVFGSLSLINRLKAAGIYPHTVIGRDSVV